MNKYEKCRWKDVEIGDVWMDSSGDVFIKIHVAGLKPTGVWLQNMSLYGTPILEGRIIGNINNLGRMLSEKADKAIEMYERNR